MKNGNTLIDHVVCQITDSIFSKGEWLPGERLPNERQLAEKYCFSRNTVREAIKVLSANNIVITKAGSGTFVADNPGVSSDPFGFSKIEDQYQVMLDLYELRILVESEAAMLVASRATDEEIDGILYYEQLCAQLIRDGKEWAFADREFHTSIARATHNSAFNRILPSIHQSSFLAHNLMNSKRNQENSLECHALIARQLARRDGTGAALAVRYHLQRAIDNLNEDLQLELNQEQHIKLVNTKSCPQKDPSAE